MKYTDAQLYNLAREFREPVSYTLHDGSPYRMALIGKSVRLTDIFKSLVREMNKSLGSRKRKHLDTLVSELQARGIKCSPPTYRDNGSTFYFHLDHYTARIKYKHREGLYIILKKLTIMSLDINVFCCVHLSAIENEIADFIEAFEKLLEITDEMLIQAEDEFKRNSLISEISHPALETIIDDYMAKKGISDYNVYVNKDGRNTLDVHVADEYWMRNDSITLANIESILRLIPYLISRPDKIDNDGQGFKRFKKRNRHHCLPIHSPSFKIDIIK